MGEVHDDPGNPAFDAHREEGGGPVEGVSAEAEGRPLARLREASSDKVPRIYFASRTHSQIAQV